MILWDIIKWLSTKDLWPSMGWNWFSLMCFTIMGLFAINRVRQYYSLNIKTLFAILIASISPLLFYFSIIDTASLFINAITQVNALTGLRYYYQTEIVGAFGIFLSSRYSFIIITAVLTYVYARKFIKPKSIAAVWLFNFGFMLITQIVFGTINMRHLSGDSRAIFWITDFVPMWTIWATGFAYSWRKKE